MKKVFLGLPYYNNFSRHTLVTVLNACTRGGGKYEIHLDVASTSATPFCFNQLLRQALDTDCDYFVMLHSDLGTSEPDWVFKLINLLETNQLDVISAVAPIKNNQGLTSTAVDNREFFPRRLTLSEINAGPEVLTNDVCKSMHGSALLINTGMMMWRMETLKKCVPEFAFEFHDGWLAMPDETGGRRLNPYFQPEDWLMSRFLDRKGIAYAATRAIATLHEGSWVWASDGPTGSQLTDQQNLHFAGLPELARVSIWPDPLVIKQDKEERIKQYEQAIESIRNG